MMQDIYSKTQFVQTLTHILTSVETIKYVSKATQLHEKILYCKIHLTLFLAKSIIASKNRAKQNSDKEVATLGFT